MIKSNAILEINKKNIIHNFKILKNLTNKSIPGVTIKANAYGIGALKTHNFLYKVGCRNFFFATLEEAVELRNYKLKGNFYVLNGLENNKVNNFAKYKIIPILNSYSEIKYILEKKIKIKIGIQVETGLNRLGVSKEELNLLDTKNLNLEILVSHLASSDELKNSYNKKQNKEFRSYFNYFKSIKYKSLVNSIGILHGKSYHYDITRPGISLYGGHYNTKIKNIIKPIITLKAKVLQIKNIKNNEYIGYNQTYKTQKKITVAILGIGYADGISRILSNKGQVFYKKNKFRILGRVSMDTITVDISKSKNIIKKGVYLEIINKEHDIEEIAKKCSTISNEILTSISKRVKRIYL